MTKHFNPNGQIKNALLIWNEIKALPEHFQAERAEQDGWTHQYMQNCRTMVRKAVVTCATLIGVVWPIVTSVLVGYVLCLALRLAAAQAAL